MSTRKPDPPMQFAPMPLPPPPRMATMPATDWTASFAASVAAARASLVVALGADGAVGAEVAAEAAGVAVQHLRARAVPPFVVVESDSRARFVGVGHAWTPASGETGLAALLQQVAHLDPIADVALLEAACGLVGIEMVRHAHFFRAACVPLPGDEGRFEREVWPLFEPPHRVGGDFTFVALIKRFALDVHASQPLARLTSHGLGRRRVCRVTVRETLAIDVEHLADEATRADRQIAEDRAAAAARNAPPPLAQMAALIDARIHADGNVTVDQPVVVARRAEHDNEGSEYRALVAWYDGEGRVAWREVTASTLSGFAAGLSDQPNHPPWWADLSVGDRFVPHRRG
jgi:hypothetical protein